MPLFERSPFIVRTDHEAVRRNLVMAKTIGELARWRFTLSEFDFKIVYLAGIKHYAANALSILKTERKDKITLKEKVPVLAVSESTVGCAPQTEIIYFELIKDPGEPFFPSFQKS